MLNRALAFMGSYTLCNTWEQVGSWAESPIPANRVQSRPVPSLPKRYHVELMLSASERKQLKAAAAADLRTQGNLVTGLVVAALARKTRVRVQAAPAERSKYTVHIRLTTQQRRELEKRAKAEGRLLANQLWRVTW